MYARLGSHSFFLTLTLLFVLSSWGGGQSAVAQEAALQAASSAGDRSFATVLMYHRFGDSRFPSTNTTIDQLEAHLALIREGGFVVWPLHEIVDAILSGQPLPPRTLGITVDDAYLSLFETGWPLFKEQQLPITVFVATDLLDGNSPDYMSWSQLKSMVSAGVTIGGHSASHTHLALLDAAAIRDELDRSSSRLREELGQAPTLFAYPYGEYSLAVIDAVQGAGFKAAFGQHSGTVHEAIPFFELPRFALNETYGSADRVSSLILNSIPLVVTDVTPRDPFLTSSLPAIGMTVAADMGDIDGLACYASSESGAATLALIGNRRVEIRLGTPLPKGRSRVNCTMPGDEGKWRWFGRQFYLP